MLVKRRTRNHPRHPDEAAKRPSRRTTAWARLSFEARAACHRAALRADPLARASSG